MSFENKYLKYKEKYIALQKQIQLGGSSHYKNRHLNDNLSGGSNDNLIE